MAKKKQQHEKYRHKWTVTGRQEAVCELCGCEKSKDGKGNVYKETNGNISHGISPTCIERPGKNWGAKSYSSLLDENKELKEQRDELLSENEILADRVKDLEALVQTLETERQRLAIK